MQRARIDNTVITVLVFIDSNKSLKLVLFFEIVFVIFTIAKNRVYLNGKCYSCKYPIT